MCKLSWIYLIIKYSKSNYLWIILYIGTATSQSVHTLSRSSSYSTYVSRNWVAATAGTSRFLTYVPKEDILAAAVFKAKKNSNFDTRHLSLYTFVRLSLSKSVCFLWFTMNGHSLLQKLWWSDSSQQIRTIFSVVHVRCRRSITIYNL